MGNRYTLTYKYTIAIVELRKELDNLFSYHFDDKLSIDSFSNEIIHDLNNQKTNLGIKNLKKFIKIVKKELKRKENHKKNKTIFELKNKTKKLKNNFFNLEDAFYLLIKEEELNQTKIKKFLENMYIEHFGFGKCNEEEGYQNCPELAKNRYKVAKKFLKKYKKAQNLSEILHKFSKTNNTKKQKKPTRQRSFSV